MANFESSRCSFLDLINDVDNVHLERNPDGTALIDANYDSEPLVPWYLTSASGRAAIGLLRPAIVSQLREENKIRRDKGLSEPWEFIEESGDDPLTKTKIYLTFKPWVDDPEKRKAVMQELCERWRDSLLFPDVCGPKKWRGEMYPVYAHPFGVHDYPSPDNPRGETNFVFEMERSACALFGIITYGVHMTIFQGCEESESGQKTMMIWVPKRASTKQTWPGYLDNSVAGGITSGMGPFESIVKESMEEASIKESIVRKHARSVGAISYFLRSPLGWLRPEIQYVYDLMIPLGADPVAFQPKPLDGEVESFELLSLEQVINRMRARSFKPNCALVLIDFLIRNGHVTAENEPDLMEIITRLHGRFDHTKW